VINDKAFIDMLNKFQKILDIKRTLNTISLWGLNSLLNNPTIFYYVIRIIIQKLYIWIIIKIFNESKGPTYHLKVIDI